MLGGVEYTSTYNENKVEQIATDATTTAALPILLAKTGSSETVTEEVRKDPTLTYSPVGNNINFETGAGQNISPHLFLTTKANAGSGAQGDEECVVLQKNADSNNSRTIYMHNGANSRGLTVQNKVSGSMTSKKLLTVNNFNQIASDCIVGEALSNIVKAKEFQVKNSDLSNGISMSQFLSIDSGYKFLCWMGIASVGWVMNRPMYFENPTYNNTKIWWAADMTLPANNANCRFSYLEIRNI